MSATLGNDDNNNAIQAGYLPVTALTVSITTTAAGSAKTAAALSGGLYRVTSTVEVSLASGVFASVVAVAGDATLSALPHTEYFMVQAGDSIAAYDAGAGSGTVKITPMASI